MDLIKPTPKEIQQLGSQNIRPDAANDLPEEFDYEFPHEVNTGDIFQAAVEKICSHLGHDFHAVHTPLGSHYEIYFDEAINDELEVGEDSE